MIFLKDKKVFFADRRAGFFILLDMLIALTITSFCLLLVFNGLERIKLIKSHSEELVVLRNRITKVLTSKKDYIQANQLEKDRSYEILPGVFVDIYHIQFEKHIHEQYGLEKVEFGIVEERKGE